MILYLDTSALVKRYFKEPYSEQLSTVWKKAADIVISAVGYAETMAAFYRKRQEADLEDAQFKKITEIFRTDWNSFIRVAVTDDLNSLVDRIASTHQLRGFDAIHLSTALLVKRRLNENFLFCCFDERLSAAARKEGLETFPAEAL